MAIPRRHHGEQLKPTQQDQSIPVMPNARQTGDAVKVIGRYPVGGYTATMLPKGLGEHRRGQHDRRGDEGGRHPEPGLQGAVRVLFDGNPGGLPEWSVP